MFVKWNINFVDISKLQKCLKFTANDSTGEELKWHNFKWFETSKITLYKIKFKYSNCKEENPKTINLRKRKTKNSASLKKFSEILRNIKSYKSLLTIFLLYTTHFLSNYNKESSQEKYLPDDDGQINWITIFMKPIKILYKNNEEFSNILKL